MKLSSFYDQVVKFGIQRDPRRDRSKIKSYPDTAILHGNPDQEIKKIAVGIDIEAAELLLADNIRQKEGLDLVIAHHPEGKAYALLFEVMQLQVDLLRQAGVSAQIAQKLLDQRKQEVERRLLPQNHSRAVDAAKVLGLAFMCVHTPADNHVFHFLNKLMAQKCPKKLKEVVDILLAIPEYKEAARKACGPQIILGSLNRNPGKILFEMTGGTEGPKDALERLRKAGVRTLISMHLSDEHFKKAQEAGLNVVIAGHISSDTLGLNLLLDRIEQKTNQIFPTTSISGFKRFRRN
jgi:putative NIF3 family GTP cyclohydrolase 1 type 2